MPARRGVGLCELVQHYSFFDFARLSGTEDGRVIEFVDHLHEHFVAPVSVVDGRYQAPTAPGTSAEMVAESVAEWTYPTGPGWARIGDRAAVGSSTVDSADKDGHA